MVFENAGKLVGVVDLYRIRSFDFHESLEGAAEKGPTDRERQSRRLLASSAHHLYVFSQARYRFFHDPREKGEVLFLPI